MSERQVQHTDGSWSREVEVTDDAVEAATRLLSGDLPYTEEYIDPTLRALVERVRDAEREAETQAGIAAIRTAERDSLRFELDKVRQVAEDYADWPNLPHSGGAVSDRLLAILDGKG